MKKEEVFFRQFLVPIHMIQEGMIVDEEVRNKYGSVVLAKGYRIKDSTTANRAQKILGENDINTLGIKIEESISSTQLQEILDSQEEIIEDIDSEPVKEEENNKDITDDIFETGYVEDKDFFRKDLLKSKKNIEKIFDKIDKDIYDEINELKCEIEKTMKIFNATTGIFQVIEKMKKEDKSLYMHCYSMAIVSYMIGKWLKLEKERNKELFILTMVADIGLLKVPADIRFNHCNLSEDSQSEYNKHIIHSVTILKNSDFIDAEGEKVIFRHHENFNKTGFPLRIEVPKIPLFSRIIYISHLYTHYTLHEGENPLKAVNRIKEEHFNEVDLDILYIFEKRIYDYFIGQKIKLSSKEGSIGEIIMIDLVNPSILIRTTDGQITNVSLKSVYRNSVEFL
ncbi:HD-GYP domain-containing protein [Brassicibacter mesophilus]|uniref:HD-GYP domain-containing protein n=1 Tax=Brassicibacter mesophilus TaxID=745119 RepID=UPI003D25F8FE